MYREGWLDREQLTIPAARSRVRWISALFELAIFMFLAVE